MLSDVGEDNRRWLRKIKLCLYFNGLALNTRNYVFSDVGMLPGFCVARPPCIAPACRHSPVTANWHWMGTLPVWRRFDRASPQLNHFAIAVQVQPKRYRWDRLRSLCRHKVRFRRSIRRRCLAVGDCACFGCNRSFGGAGGKQPRRLPPDGYLEVQDRTTLERAVWLGH